MECTNLLMQDHKIILRALDALQGMAERTERNEPVDHADVESLVRFLRVFADEYHQTKEESALFPELLKAATFNYDQLRHMTYEHNQERSMVEGLEDAVLTKHGYEFVYFSNLLVQFLRTHIKKEDSILFQKADECLTAEQDACITAELKKFVLEPALLHELRRLEWTYVRKAVRAG
jgi:hemerythrin-like domain-containing protein